MMVHADKMLSFPQMSELPSCMSTSKWSWQRVNRPGEPSDGFWIGVDKQGNRWLTKLRGSFYAYREIVFARIAQGMNWSCQSSAFICLDADAANQLGRSVGEYHAAHWYMDEHTHPSCGLLCPFEQLVDQPTQTVEGLAIPGVSHLLDWPKSEFAAYIFGGNEPPDRIFTKAHELVIIDSEQMFSTKPTSFSNSKWLKQADGTSSTAGYRLAKQVCQEIGSLNDAFISEALAIPNDIKIELPWHISNYLKAGVKFALEYTDTYSQVSPLYRGDNL
jgi:hypothetical protein